MKSRGPYKKIQGGDGQEVQDLTRSLCMSLGEVISHTPVHQQLSHLHKDLSSLLECFTSIAQVPCLLEVVLQYARFMLLSCPSLVTTSPRLGSTLISTCGRLY
ncbi:uncharacterized protein LOC107799570 isoform X5 [Nicotiana tabacum]|uniref:Uncharacterized protein LOC107799570 isoform X5 n=1 Tax=Nicotiana tabacum TaxID=4097 RepID=A0AC58TSJ5_TOBAC